MDSPTPLEMGRRTGRLATSPFHRDGSRPATEVDLQNLRNALTRDSDVRVEFKEPSRKDKRQAKKEAKETGKAVTSQLRAMRGDRRVSVYSATADSLPRLEMLEDLPDPELSQMEQKYLLRKLHALENYAKDLQDTDDPILSSVASDLYEIIDGKANPDPGYLLDMARDDLMYAYDVDLPGITRRYAILACGHAADVAVPESNPVVAFCPECMKMVGVEGFGLMDLPA